MFTGDLMMENFPTPLLVVAAALIDTDGRVLLQQRPDGKDHAGLWEFPGGKVERFETPEAALARELAEELAITVHCDDLVPLSFASGPATAHRPPIVLLLYACRRWQGVPRCEQGADLFWAGHDDLGSVPMPPLDVALAKSARTLLK